RGNSLRSLLLNAVGFGLLVVAFSLSTSFTLSLALAGASGLASVFSGINTNTMLGTNADPRMTRPGRRATRTDDDGPGAARRHAGRRVRQHRRRAERRARGGPWGR